MGNKKAIFHQSLRIFYVVCSKKTAFGWVFLGRFRRTGLGVFWFRALSCNAKGLLPQHCQRPLWGWPRERWQWQMVFPEIREKHENQGSQNWASLQNHLLTPQKFKLFHQYKLQLRRKQTPPSKKTHTNKHATPNNWSLSKNSHSIPLCNPFVFLEEGGLCPCQELLRRYRAEAQVAELAHLASAKEISRVWWCIQLHIWGFVKPSDAQSATRMTCRVFRCRNSTLEPQYRGCDEALW